MRSIPNITCFTPASTKSDLLMILNESLTKTPSYTRFQKLKDYSFNDNDSKKNLSKPKIKVQIQL